VPRSSRRVPWSGSPEGGEGSRDNARRSEVIDLGTSRRQCRPHGIPKVQCFHESVRIRANFSSSLRQSRNLHAAVGKIACNSMTTVKPGVDNRPPVSRVVKSDQPGESKRTDFNEWLTRGSITSRRSLPWPYKASESWGKYRSVGRREPLCRRRSSLKLANLYSVTLERQRSWLQTESIYYER